jgi:hypothetical protein
MSSSPHVHAILLRAWLRYSLHYTSVGSAHDAGIAVARFQWKRRGPGGGRFFQEFESSEAGNLWLTVKEVDDPSISTEGHEKAGFPVLAGPRSNRSLPPCCCG